MDKAQHRATSTTTWRHSRKSGNPALLVDVLRLSTLRLNPH